MSAEDAKAFLEKISSDEEFRQQVGELGSPEERVKFIENAGFHFTKEEMDSVSAQLSDEDLDQVAGGSWGCGTTHESEVYVPVMKGVVSAVKGAADA